MLVKVPQEWLAAYPSSKGLGTWTRDLVARVDQLWRWAEAGVLPVVWLSGLAFPRTYLTAVLQVHHWVALPTGIKHARCSCVFIRIMLIVDFLLVLVPSPG